MAGRFVGGAVAAAEVTGGFVSMIKSINEEGNVQAARHEIIRQHTTADHRIDIGSKISLLLHGNPTSGFNQVVQYFHDAGYGIGDNLDLTSGIRTAVDSHMQTAGTFGVAAVALVVHGGYKLVKKILNK